MSATLTSWSWTLERPDLHIGLDIKAPDWAAVHAQRRRPK
jgi:hypothetical protein